MDKKYYINYLPSARQDMNDILDYISKDNVSVAFSMLDRIDGAIEKLEDFPYIGIVPDDKRLKNLGYRMLIVDSYLVFYVVLDDTEVEIRRVIHGKRRYQFLL